jgi:hypothetical protein
MLDPEFKAKWVAALRSGEYKQGQHRLCREKPTTGERSFCCLGVAADLVDPNGWVRSTDDEIGSDITYHHDDGLGSGEFSNVYFYFPGYEYAADIDKLASKNDINGWTFAEIADYIEAEL